MLHTAASARALLDATLARYASLASYRDRGVVYVALSASDPPLEMPFSTEHVAPDRFRFEIECPHPHPPLRHLGTRYVIAGNGARTSLLTVAAEVPPGELRTMDTLGRAIAAVGGVSCGAAHTLAHLLRSDVRGIALADLEQLAVLGEADVCGTRCVRLSGTHPRAGAHELAIGVDDGLLRRVSKQSARHAIDEVHFAIETGVVIDPGRFES